MEQIRLLIGYLCFCRSVRGKHIVDFFEILHRENSVLNPQHTHGSRETAGCPDFGRILCRQKVGTISLHSQHGFQCSQSGRVLLIERHQLLSLRQFLLQISVGINNRQVDSLCLCNQFFHIGHQPTNEVYVLPQRVHTNTVRGAQPIQWIGPQQIRGGL